MDSINFLYFFLIKPNHIFNQLVPSGSVIYFRFLSRHFTMNFTVQVLAIEKQNKQKKSKQKAPRSEITSTRSKARLSLSWSKLIRRKTNSVRALSLVLEYFHLFC